MKKYFLLLLFFSVITIHEKLCAMQHQGEQLYENDLKPATEFFQRLNRRMQRGYNINKITVTDYQSQTYKKNSYFQVLKFLSENCRFFNPSNYSKIEIEKSEIASVIENNINIFIQYEKEIIKMLTDQKKTEEEEKLKKLLGETSLINITIKNKIDNILQQYSHSIDSSQSNDTDQQNDTESNDVQQSNADDEINKKLKEIIDEAYNESLQIKNPQEADVIAQTTAFATRIAAVFPNNHLPSNELQKISRLVEWNNKKVQDMPQCCTTELDTIKEGQKKINSSMQIIKWICLFRFACYFLLSVHTILTKAQKYIQNNHKNKSASSFFLQSIKK